MSREVFTSMHNIDSGWPDMTTKEKVISVMNSLDENASLDEVIDRLYLLRKIELGIAQADADDVMEHEEFMAELERDDAR
jgi:hypothetical protein